MRVREGRQLDASSLGFRLGVTLVLSLLPLGVLSVVQTRSAIALMEETALSGASGASIAAAQPQVDAIKAARVTAHTIATELTLGVPDTGPCIARMQAVAAELPSATLVAFVPMSGRMTCASTGEPFDFAGNPRFARIAAAGAPSLSFNPRGPVSQTAIIAVSYPVFDLAHRQTGIVAVSLRHEAVEALAYQATDSSWRPTLLTTFTSDGTLLTSSTGDAGDLRFLPADADWASLATLAGTSFFSTAADGERRIASVTEIADDLFLFGAWEPETEAIIGNAALAPFLLPVLTWIAALVAAVLASDRLVVRHVRALARSMTTYRSSRARGPAPDMTGAPTEIADLTLVYDDLVQTIERDEAELRNLLVDKDMLLKEVHHRSGNSLQMIASVMRLYRRETMDSQLRAVLDRLIDRVIALSSTHTSLYSLTDQRRVPMDEVLTGVISRLNEIHGIDPAITRIDLAPLHMAPQTAMPLALALAEILGCHHAAPRGHPGALDVTLRETKGDVRLAVQGPVLPEFLPETTTGFAAMPKRMLSHYAAQLGGAFLATVEGGSSTLELVFPHRPT